MKSFSVVIINDDAEAYLAGLFESIDKQEALGEAEIIFIDNASCDASLDAARKYGILKVYSSPRKEPAPRLYNKGLELSDTPAVLFLHSDIILCSGLFSAVIDVLRSRDCAHAIINFNQYYVDHNRFGANFVGCTVNDGAFFYRKYFVWNYDNTVELVQCSEGCFMIDYGEMKIKPGFDERYHASLFEYDYIITHNLGIKSADGSYYHYFIEAHEKLPSFEDDRALFVGRIWHFLEALKRKKIRRAKIMIVIRALADIVIPRGSFIRKAVQKALTLLKVKM